MAPTLHQSALFTEQEGIFGNIPENIRPSITSEVPRRPQPMIIVIDPNAPPSQHSPYSTFVALLSLLQPGLPAQSTPSRSFHCCYDIPEPLPWKNGAKASSGARGMSPRGDCLCFRVRIFTGASCSQSSEYLAYECQWKPVCCSRRPGARWADEHAQHVLSKHFLGVRTISRCQERIQPASVSGSGLQVCNVQLGRLKEGSWARFIMRWQSETNSKAEENRYQLDEDRC